MLAHEKHSEGQSMDSVQTTVTIYQQMTRALILSRVCGLETANSL